MRDIGVEGFDASVIDYEFERFNLRMRVRRALVEPPRQRVNTVGGRHDLLASPCVHNVNHHILPDGDMDNFRKGAPNDPLPLNVVSPPPGVQIIGATGFV